MQYDTNTKEISIIELLNIIKSKLVWILLCAIIFGAGAFLATELLIVPKYKAEISMYVYSAKREEGDISNAQLTASKELVKTYIVILKSKTVLNQVIDNLNLKMSASELANLISASSINGTEIFSVSVMHPDPKVAAKIANELGKVGPTEIVRVVQAGGVEIIDYAEEPSLPATPNRTKNTIIGILLGIILSSGIAVLVALFSTRIKNEYDLTSRFNIPVFGEIPKITTGGVKTPNQGGKTK